jgi:hypothetical protein
VRHGSGDGHAGALATGPRGRDKPASATRQAAALASAILAPARPMQVPAPMTTDDPMCPCGGSPSLGNGWKDDRMHPDDPVLDLTDRFTAALNSDGLDAVLATGRDAGNDTEGPVLCRGAALGRLSTRRRALALRLGRRAHPRCPGPKWWWWSGTGSNCRPSVNQAGRIPVGTDRVSVMRCRRSLPFALVAAVAVTRAQESGRPSVTRVCAWCDNPIPARTRRNAVCCSGRCRQARHWFLRAVGHVAVTSRRRHADLVPRH